MFALTLPCTGRETAAVELLLVLSVARSPLPAPAPAPAADRSGRRELTADSKPSTSASTQSRTPSADAEADDEPLVVRVTRRKQCIATLLTPGLVPSRDEPSPGLSHPLTALPPVPAGASAPGLGLDIVGSGDIQVRAGRHPENDPLATRQQQRPQLEPAEGSNADGAGPTSSSFSSSSAFAYYIIVAASSSLLLLLACLLLCLFMQSRRRTLKSSALLPVATTACNRRAIDQRAAGAATGPPASGPLTPNTSPNVLSPTERSGSMRVRFNPTAVSSLAAAAATARYANALYYLSSCNEATLKFIKI